MNQVTSLKWWCFFSICGWSCWRFRPSASGKLYIYGATTQWREGPQKIWDYLVVFKTFQMFYYVYPQKKQDISWKSMVPFQSHRSWSLGRETAKNTGAKFRIIRELVLRWFHRLIPKRAIKYWEKKVWTGSELVVWNIFCFFLILGIVTPTDFQIFQRGWNHQQGNWIGSSKPFLNWGLPVFLMGQRMGQFSIYEAVI